MKTSLLTILTLLLFTRASSQTELTTNNPAPRIGDGIEIRLKIANDDERAGGTITIKTPDKIGPVNIGPLKLTIGSKTFETNILTINVSPKLPDDVKDGMWIRLVEFQNEEYLIIEQRISNQWIKERKSEDEVSISHGDGVRYASLIEEKLENYGIEINSGSTNTSSQILDKKDMFGSGTVSYRRSTYKIKRTDGFKSQILIDETLFNDFPNNVKIDNIWIK